MNATHLASALLALALALAISPSSVRAQSQEEKDALIQAVGSDAGEALFSVHFAVNSLAENWQKNVFADFQAKELAASYKGSAEKVLGLVKGKSAKFEEGAGLLLKQATVLEAWIQTKEDSLGDSYRKLKAQTDTILFPSAVASGGSATEKAAADPVKGPGIELEIVKSVAPKGKPGTLGKMTVSRLGEGLPLLAEWKYPDGNGDQGLAIPFPGTGKLAVFFGKGVKTLSLYHRKGNGRISGHWCTANPSTKIQSVELTQTSPDAYTMEGENGKFSMTIHQEGLAAVTWTFDDGGKAIGIGVVEGDYLAAVAVDPDQKAGVGLYTLADDFATATSRWTMVGAGGAGTEELKVTRIPEGFFQPIAAGNAPPAAPSPRNSEVEAEIRQIAESLREDFSKAAQWKPSTSQLNSISRTLNDAEKLRAYAETLYASLPADQSAAKPGQTEILITGPELKDLPGGYGKAIEHFKPGVEIYGFKYVEPGKTTGMAYDGLFRRDGQWFFLPKAWRAFSQP